MTRDFDEESLDLLDLLDEQLDQLIEAAKQYPEKSLQQQRLLRRILNSVALRGRLFDRVLAAPDARSRSLRKQRFIWVMQKSGKKLWIPSWTSSWASKEDCADMESEVWLWFCKKFDTYVPEKACPITWCNRKLRFIASDFYQFLYKSAPPPLSLDQPVGQDGNSTHGDLVSSETLKPSDPLNIDPDPYTLAESEVLRERVQVCLKQPEFTRLCVSEEYRYIHCHSLISAFLLDQMEWEEIFQKFGVEERTLQSRIRRRYRECCLPHLRNCLNAG